MTTQQISLFGANQELLIQLVTANVRLLVVGGVAVRFYVPTRPVDDLDILVESTLENAEKVMDVLLRLRLTPNFSVVDLARPNVHLPIKGYHYADILTPPTGFDFADAYARASVGCVTHNSEFALVRVTAIDALLALIRRTPDLDEKRRNDIAVLEALL